MASLSTPNDVLKEWEDDLRNPMRAQRQVLKEILQTMQMVNTIHSRNLLPDSSLEEFIENHPLTTYTAKRDGHKNP